MEGFYYDVESDNLYLQSKKVWYIRLTSLDGSRSISIKPFQDGKEAAREQFCEWLHSFKDNCLIVFHNGLGFDAWVMWKHFDIVPVVGKRGKDWLDGKPVQYVDTYVLSMYLRPDLPFHSLDYLSSGSDNEKMPYRERLVEAGVMSNTEKKGFEFSFWNPLMAEYCDADVLAGIGVFKKLWKQAQELYGEEWLHPSFRQMQKDYWLYSAQAYSGVKFHKEKANILVSRIDKMMVEIKEEVDPLLPSRELKTVEKAFYKMPAKPFMVNGEYSSAMRKWLEKHNATIDENHVVSAYGITEKLEANAIFPVKLPMEIEDSKELKQYFLESGWKPSDDFWNFKRGTDGKPERDAKGKLIKTTPKIQHQGQICPNLLKIEGEIPKKVVKFLSLRNRKGVVEGWLNNWRVEWDGRLSAEISGYAPTSRAKHRVVCNVPKADVKVLLGSEMRELFVVEPGYWYVGTDAAALENRTLSSYTYKYDDGWFANLNLYGDVHTRNVFVFFPELKKKWNPDEEGLKDNPEFKPWRNKAKTGAYLLAFGGGAPKLASSLGLSKNQGKAAYDNYWMENVGLGKLKEAVEGYYETKGKGRYIPAQDGRIVHVRGKNVLLSCLGQGLGAICMSYAACLMDTWLGELYIDSLGRPYYLYKGRCVRRISMVHDEYSWEVEDGVQDEVRELSTKAIVRAGEILKLEIPLAAEGKMEREGSWKDVH